MNIQQIRRIVPNEEIDYVMLKSILSGYSNPRDKISRFLKAGSLIKVKKGLYVFGPDASLGPYNKEILANLIYGPSAISLEYALFYYGLIPERVETVTSITPSRNKKYSTPVGIFSYQYMHPAMYTTGLNRVMVDSTHPVIMAMPEKALSDILAISAKKIETSDVESLLHYITVSLRIENNALKKLSVDRIREIASVYKIEKVILLHRLVVALREKKR
ncbi:MAG: hypothetical protein JXA18_05595 [Chitinispirillaceae bacterium]|nr:hypothetical protein [Chitinispirillaceae bacterium]